jgi:hypothetical protein
MAEYRPFLKFLLRAAIASVVIPIAFLAVQLVGFAGNEFALFQLYLMLLLWPSSIMMMALDGAKSIWNWDALLVIAFSITANAILYIACAALLWMGRNKNWLFAIPIILGVPALWWRLLTL